MDMSAEWVTKPGRVALLVDGENLSQDHAGAIITHARALGALTIRRVYGNVALLPGWVSAPGFRLIHSGSGKNAADILLCIDAMEMACAAQADGFVIAASDRDYTHLALRLRERGLPVLGIGEAKTPAGFRKACQRFEQIGPMGVTVPPKPSPAKVPSPHDEVLAIVAAATSPDRWIAVQQINQEMHAKKRTLADLGAPTWRGFFAARTDRYEFACTAGASRVRLRQT